MQDVERKDNNYIEDAKKIAKIVSTSVENKDFSRISEKLDDLKEYGSSKERYVFCTKETGILSVENIFLWAFNILFIAIGIIGIGVFKYSKTYRTLGISELVLSIVVIILNIFFMERIYKEKLFLKRYCKYYQMLRFRRIVITDDLINYSKESKQKVIDDLNKAVNQKLIPEGHFGKDNSIFIVSNEVFEKYKSKQAFYDRYYRKQIEERNRMMERTDEMKNVISQGNYYIDRLQESNKIIKDKIISQKLDRMEQIVRMIFHEVDINPKQVDKLGLCLNYYLPTMEKLLDAYIDICDSQSKNKREAKTKKDIEYALDTLNESFERILDRFYDEKEMDIASDIAVLEVMAKQDR